MTIDLTKLNTEQYVPPDEIKTATFQPVSRTLPATLRKLKANVEKEGIINALVVSADDGCLADGHRRLAVAKALKLTVVPVKVRKGSSADLFRMLNQDTKPITAKAWHESVALGLPTEAVPEREGKYIARMIEVLGWEDYQVIALEGTTSFIYKVAEMIARYTGESSDDFLRQTIHWLYNLNMQRPAIEAMKGQTPVGVLLSAIRNNKALNSKIIWTAG